jgi:hypothetical protein
MQTTKIRLVLSSLTAFWQMMHTLIILFISLLAGVLIYKSQYFMYIINVTL